MKTIEAKIVDGDPVWQPDDISASVGEEVEWKVTSGLHGVRIKLGGGERLRGGGDDSGPNLVILA